MRRLNPGASEGTHSRSGSRQVAGAGLALSLRWNLQVIEPLDPKSRWGNEGDNDRRWAAISSHEAVDVYTYLLGSSRPHSDPDSPSPQLIL